MMVRKWLWLLLGTTALSSAALVPTIQSSGTSSAKKVNFNRDVKPILSGHCFRCHGPDVAVVAAGLRLDSFNSAVEDRNGRRAIVPGKVADSILVNRVVNHEMPPKDSDVKPLTEAQIETLKQWIAEGAKYEAHWSFVPPKKQPLPAVSNPKWARNPIDRFVLSRLDEAGLLPAEEADKNTLIARVAVTLTGLPPEPSDVAQYLQDNSSDAYEKMVDRYLNSPRYGEHQARYWLDAVRYGDTHGLHLDNERGIFPFRDWVVRAFNEDLPFDKFTEWQLAGDLLPKPTVDQLVATGYVRMNPTTNEGGAIEEEFQAKNTFDRVDTTSTVFLGLTVACARCHDHKYDPISQKEYYQLYAFFNSTADRPLDGNELLPAPFIPVPNKKEEQTLNELTSKIASLVKSVKIAEAEAWLVSSKAPTVQNEGWELSGPYVATDFEKAYATAYGPEPGGQGTAEWKPFKFEIGKQFDNIGGKENAATYVRGTLIAPEAANLEVSLSSDDAIKVWLNGTSIHENKVLRGVNLSVDNVNLKLQKGANTLLMKVVNSGGPDGIFLRFGGVYADRIAALNKSWFDPKLIKNRKPSELAELYLIGGPSTPVSEQYKKLLVERDAFVAMLPKTLVAQELPKPRPAHILKRGEYSMPGELVGRGIPKALGTVPEKNSDRLAFAKWLTASSNPLVARVFANRIWQQHFGIGIVRTAEDFGAQGEWPSDPALLDFLAVYFRENQWSVKKLNRLILTSAAFRQASVVTKAKLEKDPENRWISRGPRFRLDAEVIRDKALAVSGLLLEKVGGKGFKPYQPDGIWEAITFVESTTSKYVRDMGTDIYRRSLYLFWKRTSPHPVMLSFDAPMRESCTVRRSRTNTPVQALVTMNEPAFLESARAMAQRVLVADADDSARLQMLGMIAFSRQLSPKEVGVLSGALTRYRERFTKSPADAESVLKLGDSPRDTELSPIEHASWMLICSTLMNTDEFLTQH